MSHFLLTLIVVRSPPGGENNTKRKWVSVCVCLGCAGLQCVWVTYLTVDINDILRAISYFTLCCFNPKLIRWQKGVGWKGFQGVLAIQAQLQAVGKDTRTSTDWLELLTTMGATLWMHRGWSVRKCLHRMRKSHVCIMCMCVLWHVLVLSPYPPPQRPCLHCTAPAAVWPGQRRINFPHIFTQCLRLAGNINFNCCENICLMRNF